MEGLDAIDEQLEALAEGRDTDAIVAKAHGELPEHSESFEIIDAMIENLGEAVSIPTVEPVGIDIPKPELPDIQAAPDTAVHESVPPAEGDIPETREHEAPPKSAAEMAAEADAEVDALADGSDSESGLDADDLFGDLSGEERPAEDMAVDITDALAQVRAMTSENPPPADAAPEGAEAQPPAEVAEAVAEGAAPEPPTQRPRTEPPPPPVEAGARDSIEELDLDEIMIEEDDSFELMIDEDEAADTFVGDADAVENALAEGDSSAQPSGEGEGEGDDAREQSFFKKIFG